MIKLATRIFFIFTMFFCAEEMLSQNIPDISVSGNYQDKPLKEILTEMEEKYDIKFSYIDQLVDSVFISVSFKNKKLSDALNIILKETHLSFKIYPDSRNIILYKNKFGVSSSKHTISGYVQDAESGEKLIGANIYEPDLQSGTTSNTYGFFSLTLPGGSMKLVVSYIGYQTFTRDIVLNKDTRLNINLSPTSLTSDTLTISAERFKDIAKRTQMSQIEIPITQIRTLPALAGEVDVLKAIQLLPGVQSGTEGTSGIYVRGGGPDQNLILLDGAPVYNASHLFGFFSIFNPDAIKNVKLIKGGFPASYGGRLSSVVEINMKEGNMKEFKGSGSIGLIASSLTLEGPIIKDKSSFIISGRKSYIDVWSRSFSGDKRKYGFYDFNTKVNHVFSHNDRIYLSFYTGNNDFIDNKGLEFELGWRNTISTFRWNHIISDKLFSNTTFTYSKYRFESTKKAGSDSTISTEHHFSGVRDWSAKVDFDFLPNPNHYIKFGGNVTYHTFSPGAYRFTDKTIGDTTVTPSLDIDASEYAFYLEDDLKLTHRLKANAGLHISGFEVNNRTYSSIEPRISMRYLITDQWALKSSYAAMEQYIHLLTNVGVGLPTDLWVSATDKVKPQESRQFAMGVAGSFSENKYELSIEGYYKPMKNVIEYKNGSNFLLGLDSGWDDKVEPGNGLSYGIEFFLEKKKGNTTGWIGYTFSRTNRQFKDINFGETFPYKYDRRHDISIVFNHKITKNIDISGNWIYGTGNAVTLSLTRHRTHNLWPLRPQANNGPSVLHYESRNNYRMAAYHRLDIVASYHKSTKRGEMAFEMGLYNTYNRNNPQFLIVEAIFDEDPVRVFQTGLFPILPFISYKFIF